MSHNFKIGPLELLCIKSINFKNENDIDTFFFNADNLHKYHYQISTYFSIYHGYEIIKTKINKNIFYILKNIKSFIFFTQYVDFFKDILLEILNEKIVRNIFMSLPIQSFRVYVSYINEDTDLKTFHNSLFKNESVKKNFLKKSNHLKLFYIITNSSFREFFYVTNKKMYADILKNNLALFYEKLDLFRLPKNFSFSKTFTIKDIINNESSFIFVRNKLQNDNILKIQVQKSFFIHLSEIIENDNIFIHLEDLLDNSVLKSLINQIFSLKNKKMKGKIILSMIKNPKFIQKVVQKYLSPNKNLANLYLNSMKVDLLLKYLLVHFKSTQLLIRRNSPLCGSNKKKLLRLLENPTSKFKILFCKYSDSYLYLKSTLTDITNK